MDFQIGHHDVLHFSHSSIFITGSTESSHRQFQPSLSHADMILRPHKHLCARLSSPIVGPSAASARKSAPHSWTITDACPSKNCPLVSGSRASSLFSYPPHAKPPAHNSQRQNHIHLNKPICHSFLPRKSHKVMMRNTADLCNLRCDLIDDLRRLCVTRCTSLPSHPWPGPTLAEKPG